MGSMGEFIVFQHITSSDIAYIKKTTNHNPPVNPMEFVQFDIHNQWKTRHGKIIYKNDKPMVGYKSDIIKT